jgi:hypothetical protein
VTKIEPGVKSEQKKGRTENILKKALPLVSESSGKKQIRASKYMFNANQE